MSELYHAPFEQEIPKSRVNITLDVDTQGSRRKQELPLKLLVLGQFNAQADAGNIASREKVAVNKHNIHQVIEKLSPQLSLLLKNRLDKASAHLAVDLSFQHLTDFHPSKLVQQVPALRRLLAMRHLLKELKARLLGDKNFQQHLNTVFKDTSLREQLEALLANQEVCDDKRV